jgi:ribosome-binding factor A
MGTRRQERLNSFIVREISAIIRDIKNGELGFVTITRCDISPDLREAKIYFSVFGEADEVARNLALLERNRGFIRSRLGKNLGTRLVPQLHFEFESAIAIADEMSRLINFARASDPHPNDAAATADNVDGAAATHRHTDADNPIGDFPAPRRDLA